MRRALNGGFLVCHLGCSQERSVLCWRSFRYQAILLRATRRSFSVQQHIELRSNAPGSIGRTKRRDDRRFSAVGVELRQRSHKLSRHSAFASSTLSAFLREWLENPALLEAAYGRADPLFEAGRVRREFSTTPASRCRGPLAHRSRWNLAERRDGFVIGGGGGESRAPKWSASCCDSWVHVCLRLANSGQRT